MSDANEITKEQLFHVIDSLSNQPEDRVRILGDFGIAAVGIAGGMASAGSLAGLAGATSIPFLTTGASWLGVTAIAATPAGWVIGAALAGGALTYGVSRLVRDGSMAEERKKALLVNYRQRLKEITQKEQAQTISLQDKNELYLSVRELVDKNMLTPELAKGLILSVERGSIPLSEAYEMMRAVLQELGSFCLIAPLALKVAAVDGMVDHAELAHIAQYFNTTMGYESSFISAELDRLIKTVDSVSVEDVAEKLAQFLFQNNAETYQENTQNIIEMLNSIMMLDGVIDPREVAVIEVIQDVFDMVHKQVNSDHKLQFIASKTKELLTNGLLSSDFLSGAKSRVGSLLENGILTVRR